MDITQVSDFSYKLSDNTDAVVHRLPLEVRLLSLGFWFFGFWFYYFVLGGFLVFLGPQPRYMEVPKLGLNQS